MRLDDFYGDVSPHLTALSTANFSTGTNRHDATGELGQPQEAQESQKDRVIGVGVGRASEFSCDSCASCGQPLSGLAIEPRLDVTREFFEVGEGLSQDGIDSGVIYPQVIMDQDIPESRHWHNTLRERRRKDAGCSEDTKDIGLVFRGGQILFRNDVVADVQSTLNCHL